METSATPAKPPRLWFGAVWDQAVDRFRAEWKLLLLISLIANSVSILLNLIPFSTSDDFGIAAVVIVILGIIAGVIISAWGTLALYFVAARPGEATTVAEAFRKGGSFFFQWFTTSIISSLLLFLALLLFIIPGIILAVAWSMASMAVFKEGVARMAALRRSRELTKGRWWYTFSMLLILGVVIAIPFFLLASVFSSLLKENISNGYWTNIATNLFSAAIMPMVLLFESRLYDHLKETQ